MDLTQKSHEPAERFYCAGPPLNGGVRGSTVPPVVVLGPDFPGWGLRLSSEMGRTITQKGAGRLSAPGASCENCKECLDAKALRQSPRPRSEVVIEVGAPHEDIQNARRIIGQAQGWIDRRESLLRAVRFCRRRLPRCWALRLFTVISWARNSNRTTAGTPVELILLRLGVWRLVVTVTVLIDFHDHGCLL